MKFIMEIGERAWYRCKRYRCVKEVSHNSCKDCDLRLLPENLKVCDEIMCVGRIFRLERKYRDESKNE